MKIRFTCLLLLLAFLPLQAQHKSVARAAAASLIMPGLGQFYAGNTDRGMFFLGTDIAILTTYIALKSESNRSEKNYKRYAELYAGAVSGQGDDYYKAMQSYYNLDSFNNDDYHNPVPMSQDLAWQWKSVKNWNRYIRLRHNDQKLEIYTKLSAGALLANRVISMIDAARTVRRQNHQARSSMYFCPTDDGTLMVNYEFKF